MADSAKGLERNLDSTSYSPISKGDRGTAERIPFSVLPADVRDPEQTDLASLLKLGTLKQEMGKDAEAEELFRKALELADRTLGPDHPELMLLLSDLTRLYLRKSGFAAAEPLLLRLLEMKRSKGEDHPEVATVLATLANVRQSLGRHESAEHLWRRVLDIRERTLAPNHFAIATALEHLGESCAARGKIDEAITVFQRALSIRERTLGAEHPSMRVSRERIADLQLQASDVSLDRGTTPDGAATPERYRLISGESRALTAPTVPVRDKPPTPTPRKASARIHQPFADRSVTEETPPRVEAPLSATPSLADAAGLGTAEHAEPMPYQDVLESLREELEEPSTGTIGERAAQLLGSLLGKLVKKQVVAGMVVGALALLLLAVVTSSHASVESEQATAFLPAVEASPTTTLAAPANALTTSEEGSPVAKGGATNAPKSPPTHPAAIETRPAATKKTSEKRPETRPISMPIVSSVVMSRLDSLATKASSFSASMNEPVLVEAPNPLGTRRSTFESDQTTAPQRARLIGELPTPRVPAQVTDVEGEVRVQFTVDVNGRPVMATLSVVNSPNQLLTEAVRKVIPGMRFEPARTGGSDAKAIADVVQIGFQFSRLTP